jgi:hypothetical protein
LTCAKVSTASDVPEESTDLKFDDFGLRQVAAAIHQISKTDHGNNVSKEMGMQFRTEGKGHLNENDSGNPRRPFQRSFNPHQAPIKEKNAGPPLFQRHDNFVRQFDNRPIPPRQQGFTRTLNSRFSDLQARGGPQQQRNFSRPDRPFGEREKVLLANPNDDHYGKLVREVREGSNIAHLNDLIGRDISGCTPKLRDELRQNRLSKPRNQNPHHWVDGKYLIDNCRPITFPVFRKIGSRSPDLTAEALRHFTKCCHACGFDACQGKNNVGCPYNKTSDSWYLCDKCNLGFHLTKDCLASVRKN